MKKIVQWLTAQPLGLIIAVVGCIITLIGVIIAYIAYQSQDAQASPYFIASYEPVTTTDSLDYAWSLKNIGGRMRSVKCNYVAYIKTSIKDITKEEIEDKYVKIIIEDNAVKYNNKTQTIPVIRSLPLIVKEIECIEPILQFNANESLYSKYQNEEMGKHYDPRIIDYEFIECLVIEYKDYMHRDRQLILEIPKDSELDNYAIKERNDLPSVPNSSTFNLGNTTKIEVCSKIFSLHNIKYTINGEHFEFIH